MEASRFLVPSAVPKILDLPTGGTLTITGEFPATVGSKQKAIPFRGVVLQKQHRAAGMFIGSGQAGKIDLK